MRGHCGRGQDIWGPRVPLWLPGPPNIGERSGVDRFEGEFIGAGEDRPKGWRGPDIMGGGEGAQGDGGRYCIGDGAPLRFQPPRGGWFSGLFGGGGPDMVAGSFVLFLFDTLRESIY